MAGDKSGIVRDADEILQEIRIVLPGTQALLGFQFVAFFNPTFISLSDNLKHLHFATLILTMLCTIMLISPVAFQQIGEGGRTTRSFVHFARRMLNTAMLLLLLAFAGDLYLAARAINFDAEISTFYAGAVFVVGILLWYVYAKVRKNSGINRR